MPDFSVVDTHVHTHRSSAIGIQAMGGQPRVPGYTGVIEELLPLMRKAGISHAAMVNFTPVADMVDAARSRMPADMTASQRVEAEEGVRQEMVGRVVRRNEWSCQVAQEHPRLLAFIGVDPIMDAENQEQELEDKKAKGARGLKLHTFVQRFALNDRRLWPTYKTAEALEMVIIAHSGPFQGGSSEFVRPGLGADVLRDFPKLTVVLAHGGGWPYFQESIQLTKEFPSIAFDCCGVAKGRPGPDDLSDDELVALFRELGVHRITYGSDWPFRDPIPDIERILSLPMSEEEKRMILGENARRMLKL